MGQFEFVEWMPDNHLRHSRFIGLREDKNARDVIRMLSRSDYSDTLEVSPSSSSNASSFGSSSCASSFGSRALTRFVGLLGATENIRRRW